MLDVFAGLLKALIIVPIMIAFYLFAFLLISVIFIGLALIVASPFILIIGLVLWIFF